MGLRKLLTQSIVWRSFYYFSLLLVNVFLSRYLQAAITGNLYFVTIIFSFMQVVLGLGGESGIIYFASGNIIERNKLITLTAAWSLVAGIAMTGFVYLYFLIDAHADKTFLTWYCMYGFLYVFGQLLSIYSSSIYYTKENYFLPNFLLSLVNLVFIFTIPFNTVAQNHTDAQWIIFLYFTTFTIGGLLIFASYAIQFKKAGAIRFPGRQDFAKLLRYSFTALGANVVFFLVYRIDYLFVYYSPVCTDADLGNYIQVSKIGQLMLTIPQIIAIVVFPQTASGADQQTLNRAITTITRIFSQLYLAVFIAVAIIGKQFFTIVFGESFNKMQWPMLILIPGIFFLSVLALLMAYFAGKGRIKVNLYAAIIGLVVMVTGDLLFVPRYGIIGAAAVSTVSYMANTGFCMWQYYRDNAIPWKEFFSWRKSDYNWLFSMLKLKTSAS